MYTYDQKPNTEISSDSDVQLQNIKEAEYSVLVGRNNCGKSFLLKTLTQQWGQGASYIGPARYQNFNMLGMYMPVQNKKEQRHYQFMSQWLQQQQNVDNSPVNLQESIASLTDDQRQKLIEIISILLGVKLEILNIVPNNSMSQKYISCDGHNLSYTSSGFRLILTIITSLLDNDYDTFLIDEPELGISPEAQGVLADFLINKEHRNKYFNHIKNLVIATHSTIFLDRSNIRNNFRIEKNGSEISIKQIENQQDFNRIHFFLLGNRFETLYLPSVILLVEGKTDHAFIERVLAIKYPNTQFSIISANSDDRIKEVLSVAKGIFNDIQKSPYRGRIFVILDSVHSFSLPEKLISMGVSEECIIKWDNNGIEFVYPPDILDKIYGNGGCIKIEKDNVERNGISYTKNELSHKVMLMLNENTTHSQEFLEKLLSKLEGVIAT